ncbi:hypothetical protein [Amycolatopsis thermoflava]|uniref:hypothetical protein n=1 Tax=Amycolatopsis thermoflava TaxID=84480 RepID=UPI0004104A5E|nr:hypothetical protein [Amycolatopsis thermoflava]
MAIKRCISAFSVFTDGVPRVVPGGALIDDSDPVYKGRESYFEAVETGVKRDRPVETATAAPGELRQTDTPRRGRPPGSKNKPKDEEPDGGDK